MARNTYFPETYLCPICHQIQKHYTWSAEIETTRHKCSNKQGDCIAILSFENLHQEEITPVFSIKMTKGQIVRERRARSTEHFRKEIVPTLPQGSDERKHFNKKHGLKD